MDDNKNELDGLWSIAESHTFSINKICSNIVAMRKEIKQLREKLEMYLNTANDPEPTKYTNEWRAWTVRETERRARVAFPARYTPSKNMADAFQKFLLAGHELIDAWNEDLVENYPPYLPSFEDFLLEFSYLMDKDNKLK